MKTRDEAIRDMADRAADQCEVLANKLTAIIDGEDEDGEADADRLRGIGYDKGRAGLIFAEDGVDHARTWVYVDAILALAKLLRGEVHMETTHE